VLQSRRSGVLRTLHRDIAQLLDQPSYDQTAGT